METPQFGPDKGILHCKIVYLLLNPPNLKFFIPLKHDFERFYLYFWGSKHFDDADKSAEKFFRENQNVFRHLPMFAVIKVMFLKFTDAANTTFATDFGPQCGKNPNMHENAHF